VCKCGCADDSATIAAFDILAGYIGVMVFRIPSFPLPTSYLLRDSMVIISIWILLLAPRTVSVDLYGLNVLEAGRLPLKVHCLSFDRNSSAICQSRGYLRTTVQTRNSLVLDFFFIFSASIVLCRGARLASKATRLVKVGQPYFARRQRAYVKFEPG